MYFYPISSFLLFSFLRQWSSFFLISDSVDHKPAEKLGIQGNTFEDQTTDMINNVFKPLGFELVTFSRVPYLSEGDLSTSFYVLHDAIFVLKVANNTTQSCWRTFHSGQKFMTYIYSSLVKFKNKKETQFNDTVVLSLIYCQPEIEMIHQFYLMREELWYWQNITFLSVQFKLSLPTFDVLYYAETAKI